MTKTMQELEPGDYWTFDYNKNEIYKLLRWEKKGDGEDIPIVQRVASFWTYEQKWKIIPGKEERCNPYARVHLARVIFEIQ